MDAITVVWVLAIVTMTLCVRLADDRRAHSRQARQRMGRTLQTMESVIVSFNIQDDCYVATAHNSEGVALRGRDGYGGTAVEAVRDLVTPRSDD